MYIYKAVDTTKYILRPTHMSELNFEHFDRTIQYNIRNVDKAVI